MNSKVRLSMKPSGSSGKKTAPRLLLNDEEIESREMPSVASLNFLDVQRKPRRSMLGRRTTSILQNDEKDGASIGAGVVRPNVAAPSPNGLPKFNVPARKPRRSNLGRRSIIPATHKSDAPLMSFPKPLKSSSPNNFQYTMTSSTPIETQNPFKQNFDSSAFFGSGKSDLSTWSIFKNQNRLPPSSIETKKTVPKPLFRSLNFGSKIDPSQDAKNDSSLEVEPLSSPVINENEANRETQFTDKSCEEKSLVDTDIGETNTDLEVNEVNSEPDKDNTEITFEDENTVVENRQLRSSGKKLSVIREEDGYTMTINVPAIVEEEELPKTPETTESQPSNISDLINRWNGLYNQWKSTCQEMELVGKEISERLQKIELKEKPELDESSTSEADKENAPLREMRKSIYSNYKTQFSIIQTPKVAKTAKPLTTCYTPNSLSAQITRSMKDIYSYN